MNLRDLLLKDFGVDLPISGGLGNSRDSPIVVHRAMPNDFSQTEYLVLQCLGLGRGVEWNLLQQSLLSHNDRKIDQIKIETTKMVGEECVTQVENYYFDITECLEP